MIDKIHFADGKARKFVPYKGWLTELDEPAFTFDSENSCRAEIVSFLPQMPHEHWKYNLKRPDGTFVLDKKVRKITWDENGYFLIYDDNEDELIGKYKSYFPSNEYHHEYKLADKNGNLISEIGFQSIVPYYNLLFRVEYENKFNVMDLSGRYLLSDFVDLVFGITGGYLYYANKGILYRVENGAPKVVKHLREFDRAGRYYCGHNVWIENGRTLDGRPMHETEFFSHGIRGVWKKSQNDQYEPEDIQVNILIRGKYLLFDKWYNDLKNLGQGLFAIKYGIERKVIDAAETVHVNDALLIASDEIHSICQTGKSFFIKANDGRIVYGGFTSCIWADRGGIWNLQVADGTKQHYYFHGQAPEILNFAQSIIVGQNALAILERDSIWYMITKSGKLRECFRNYKLCI